MISLNLYLIINKIVGKFNTIFKEFNKIVKANNKIYNPSIIITIKDKKETFKVFYTYFLFIIAPLRLNNIYKTYNLKRLIFSRLRYYILGIIFPTFYIYIDYL